MKQKDDVYKVLDEIINKANLFLNHSFAIGIMTEHNIDDELENIINDMYKLCDDLKDNTLSLDKYFEEGIEIEEGYFKLKD